MRGGTLLAFIQEKPASIAGHGAQGERVRTGRVINSSADHNVGASLLAMQALRSISKC